MKSVNVSTNKSKEEVLAFLRNNDKVNENVRFNDKKGGTPYMHIKEKDGRLKIKCEMVGRPTKDNGFVIMGTSFHGRVTEKDGQTQIVGIATTSVIYHVIMSLLVVFLVFCIIAFHMYQLLAILACVIACEFIFFNDEFKKQGYIIRYIERAIKRLEKM